MTTWTLDQVNHVGHLYAACRVESDSLERDYFRDAMKREIARAFVRYAEPLAVIPDPRDMRFEERPAPEKPEGMFVIVTGFWSPTDRPIELRGGEWDGEVVSFRGAPHDPFVTPIRPVDFLSAMFNPSDDPLRKQITWCTGWREDTRCWVYEAQS